MRFILRGFKREPFIGWKVTAGLSVLAAVDSRLALR